MDTLRRLALAFALLGLPSCLEAPNEETSASASTASTTSATTGHGTSTGTHTGTSTSTGTTATGTTGSTCDRTRDQLCASCSGACTLGTDSAGCLTLVSCEFTDTGSTGQGGSTGQSCRSPAQVCSPCSIAVDCEYAVDANGCATFYACSHGATTGTTTTGTTGQGGTTGNQCQPAGAQGSTGGGSNTCSITNAYENCSQRSVDCTGTSCSCTEGNTQLTVSTSAIADCRGAYAICFDGAAQGSTGTTGQQGSSTPLVLSFGGERVAFVQARGRFELSGRGDRTDWVTAATPWLALDVNGNGRIDDGSELFGSMTVLADGRRARDGFEALAALDANHDGVIDAKDLMFGKLVLWRDDGDRVSQRGELQSLAQAGVLSLELGYGVGRACDARGNCEVERARFTFQGPHGKTAQGALVDVHLAHQPVQVASLRP